MRVIFIKIVYTTTNLFQIYGIIDMSEGDSMNNKVEHLKMIQSIISRMGNNSFMLKGWGIGVMIAIFAFAGKGAETECVIFTLIPLIIFWLLDSYYLFLEKKYRVLYDDVRTKDEKEIDFSMNPNDVKILLGEVNKKSYVACVVSKTEFLFYITCIAVTLLIYFSR